MKRKTVNLHCGAAATTTGAAAQAVTEYMGLGTRSVLVHENEHDQYREVITKHPTGVSLWFKDFIIASLHRMDFNPIVAFPQTFHICVSKSIHHSFRQIDSFSCDSSLIQRC